jgi:tetratricopeptide (TPR) repeat protein
VLDEEIPAWLEEEVAEEVEVAPEPPAPVPAAEDVSAGEEDMPNWLQKLRDEEEPAPAVEPVAAAVETVETVAAPTVTEKPDDGLPSDADERLKLARLARDKGEIEEAVRVYDSLVASGSHLDRVIDDLEQSIKSYPSNYQLFQLMGDAMMKDGRLQSALDVYRQALTKL